MTIEAPPRTTRDPRDGNAVDRCEDGREPSWQEQAREKRSPFRSDFVSLQL